jgi:hypothetical protein
MAITYEEKLSQSPLVDFVFQTEDLTDGVYVASAHARWDIIFTKCPDGSKRVLLCGPSFKARQVPYSPGYKHVGICYKPWAIFAGVPITTMLNETRLLPMASLDTFIMQGKTWKMPTYENVDMSLHSVQRHFAKTIGMSPRRVGRINSARTAVKLLQQGKTLSEVAYELDYADRKMNATQPGIHTADD